MSTPAKQHPLPRGLYPVLFTPLTEEKEVDWAALKALVEFYCTKGLHGMFQNCLTGECYDFPRATLLQLAKRTVEYAAGRATVVAGGNCSGGDLRMQAAELAETYAQGVAEAVILVAALPPLPEGQTLGQQLVELAGLCPGVPLGLYEVPVPHHTLLSLDDLRLIAGTNRFRFVKDTCRDNAVFAQRLRAVEGSSVQLFQANLGCCPASLELGAAGFSGFAANIAPELMLRLWALTPGGGDTREERAALHAAITALQAECTRDGHWPAGGKRCVAARPGGVPLLADTVFSGAERWHTKPLTEEARQRVAAFAASFDFASGKGDFPASQWGAEVTAPAWKKARPA